MITSCRGLVAAADFTSRSFVVVVDEAPTKN